MHLLSLRNLKLWLESFTLSILIIGVIESFMSIIDISLLYFLPETTWLYRLLFFLLFILLLTILISFLKAIFVKHFLTIKIRNITVHIKQGDLFKSKGKKIIPVNEYFDTKADDIIIAKKSLHGLFLNNYVKNIEELKQKIENYDENNESLKKYLKNNCVAYPLGRIITYEDFFLLSSTEFNEKNEAHLTKSKYENCLINMWKEICQKYAFNPIFVPLIGSGIARIDDWLDRTNFDILKFILYTLYISFVDIRKPITIVLTKETMKSINIYELKGVRYL